MTEQELPQERRTLHGFTPDEASELLNAPSVKMRFPRGILLSGLERVETIRDKRLDDLSERVTEPTAYDFMIATLIQEALERIKLGSRR